MKRFLHMQFSEVRQSLLLSITSSDVLRNCISIFFDSFPEPPPEGTRASCYRMETYDFFDERLFVDAYRGLDLSSSSRC